MESEQLLVVEIDRAGLIRSANRPVCRMRGLDAAEIEETGLLYLVHAEERDALSEMLREALGGGDGSCVVARVLTSGEEAPSVLWSAVPVRGPEGEAGSLVCFGMDLSGHLQSPGGRDLVLEELAAARESLACLQEENQALRRELESAAAEGRNGSTGQAALALLDTIDDGAPTLAELEGRYIGRVLEQTGGRVSGGRGAAAILGLHPNTLRSRMKKLGVGARVP